MKPGTCVVKIPLKYKSNRAGSFYEPALLILALILQYFTFPNDIFLGGLGPLAYVSLVPLIMLIRQCSAATAPLYGGLFGLGTVAMSMSWLMAYHSLALWIACAFALVFFALLASLLQLVFKAMPQLFWLFGPFIWVFSEFIRVQGFLGTPYLIEAYSQYGVQPLLVFTSWAGIWPLSFLIVWPAFIVSDFFEFDQIKRQLKANFSRLSLVAIAIWFGLFICALVYGEAQKIDTSSFPSKRLALIQHNMDPWVGGDQAYREGFLRLKRLSTESLAAQPDLIVWSETAFIPSIEYHLRYREDPVRLALVEELLAFLEQIKVPVLFGQNHSLRSQAIVGTEPQRQNYNAAVLFKDGEIADIYAKQHLIPFSEYFPYGDIFPGIKQWLVDHNTNFWVPGTKNVLFDAAGIRFTTPICFEDSFADISRSMVAEGAEVLINLSNDTWSKSAKAMEQHLSMAVFRAAENQVSMVRATNGGRTVAIDPNGYIIQSLPIFTEDLLIVDLKIYRGPSTPYARYGDWFAYLAMIVSLIGISLGVFLLCVRKFRRNNLARTSA